MENIIWRPIRKMMYVPVNADGRERELINERELEKINVTEKCMGVGERVNKNG